MRKFLDTVLILCLISLSFTSEESARSVYQPARGGTMDQCNDGEVDYVTYDSSNLRIPSEGVANIVMRLSNIESSGGIIICDDDVVELATENFAVIASDSATRFNVPTDAVRV